jgi:alkanesulfonate monooxygenase SsuD/methylene tetrahydromethanopterin reductase-like flavin-dependent oxidoreductase (luciferase family)
MITSTMRFNMALPGQDPAENAKRHQAALAMAEAADAAGLVAISLEEHHGVTVDGEVLGWCAAPMTMAAAILARTSRVTVGLWGLALPLHDPLRMAEDVATLDLLAPGRVVLTVNAGYREPEFAAHGQDFDRRDEVFDHKLELLRTAWTQGEVEIGGRTFAVTPRPASQPHPMLLVGGASAADAVRAAKHGLPFRPSADVAELRDAYESACAEFDSRPMYLAPPARVSLVQVAHDPDQWWDQVGECLLREAQVYNSWIQPGEHSAVHSRASTVEELRAEGRYQVLTPAECIAQAQADRSVLLHPLCGGTPLELAETTAALFVDQVLPALNA